LRAPTYAHMNAGIDGRTFVGHGMIQTEDDLSLINLPDPYPKFDKIIVKKPKNSSVIVVSC
jgi:hypothetical protein